jgi:hypothetical protein
MQQIWIAIKQSEIKLIPLESEKMKSLNLAVILSTVALLVSGAAFAEDTYKKNVHNQNFMSKRPYAQPLADGAYEKKQ